MVNNTLLFTDIWRSILKYYIFKLKGAGWQFVWWSSCLEVFPLHPKVQMRPNKWHKARQQTRPSFPVNSCVVRGVFKFVCVQICLQLWKVEKSTDVWIDMHVWRRQLHIKRAKCNNCVSFTLLSSIFPSKILQGIFISKLLAVLFQFMMGVLGPWQVFSVRGCSPWLFYKSRCTCASFQLEESLIQRANSVQKKAANSALLATDVHCKAIQGKKMKLQS